MNVTKISPLPFFYSAPSKCHPNPCENGATCTDKYYYMDVVEGIGSQSGTSELTTDVGASMAATTADVMHKMQENEELAIINEESNSISKPVSGSNNEQSTAEVAQERSTLELTPSDFHVNDLSKEEIHNGAGETPTTLKGIISRNDYGFIARRNAIGAKNISSISSSKLWKRDTSESLPSGVDQSILDTFGFYCSCPEGFKGLKCARRFLFQFFLFILIYTLQVFFNQKPVYKKPDAVVLK